MTVPGARSFGCDVAAAAVCMNTLTGKFVPVKFAIASTVATARDKLPVADRLRWILVDQKSTLTLRSAPTVAITNSDVDPVVHPLEQVP